MKSVVLYLVRHGAIASNHGKSFIGQTDVPLSDEGIAQAGALSKWLARVPLTRTISSDLSRSRRTCEIIAGRRACTIESMSALREIHLGDWENVSFHEIKSRFPEEFAARGRDIENWRPPNGENFADCAVRVCRAIDEVVSSSHGNVLLVAHAGVNRLILCFALGIPIKNLLNIGQDYGCLNVLEFDEDGVRVRLMNWRPQFRVPDEQISSSGAMGGRMFLEYCL